MRVGVAGCSDSVKPVWTEIGFRDSTRQDNFMQIYVTVYCIIHANMHA